MTPRVPFVWLGASDIAQEGNGMVKQRRPILGRRLQRTPKNGLYSNPRATTARSGAEDGAAIGLSDWPEPFYDLGAM